MQTDFTLLVFYTSLFCIIKLDNPGPGLSKTYKSLTHESFPSLQGGLSVPRQRVFCSHLLHCTCNHSRGKLREAKRWNWITEGTQQCGKRKWGEIRCLDGQGERVKRDKHRQRDRKSEGGPTPQSQRIDVKEGINSWIQLLSMSLVTAAREWLSLWRFWTVFFLPFSALTPLHRNLKQCCLTCSRQSGRRTVLMKFLVPGESHISHSSFQARCGQETPAADFYLSESLLHSQESAWLHHSFYWPFIVPL